MGNCCAICHVRTHMVASLSSDIVTVVQYSSTQMIDALYGYLTGPIMIGINT